MIETALLCLALNVYHEARGEPLVGQKAVAQVTLNRAGRAPDKVCDVVFAPYQFSWANELTTADPLVRRARAKRFMPAERRAWRQAKKVAHQALAGTLPDVVGGATHYHTVEVSPYWAPHLRFVRRVGAHRFYEES